jgi:putative DNA methylase
VQTLVPISTTPVQSPFRHISADEVSVRARAEARNREISLPPVSVYRWWARRTTAVVSALIEAAEKDSTSESLLIVDPFAGGGTIPLASVQRGHRTFAQDINPWAAAGLRTVLSLPPAEEIRDLAAVLAHRLAPRLAAAYGTTVEGELGVISHTFRVATAECPTCHDEIVLFPHALVSLKQRKERGDTAAFVACRFGHLSDGRSDRQSRCSTCSTTVTPTEAYTARRVVKCPSCSVAHKLMVLAAHKPWSWRVVLVERTSRGRRQLGVPTSAEIAAADSESWSPIRDLGTIKPSRETSVLLRHGFTRWQDLYPRRQRALLEELLGHVDAEAGDTNLGNAMRMAIVGSVEMAGLCSRWDRWYLKSYETMAGHRFNFTTFAAEPNVWGSPTSGRGTVLRRVDQLILAAEWAGKNLPKASHGDITVREGSAATIDLADGEADVVLTDPPYHDDVNYADLSYLFRAWAGMSMIPLEGEAVPGAASGQTYGSLLTEIFTEVRRVLRPDGHFVFSFANRDPHAWQVLFESLSFAGFRAVGCEIFHSENEVDHSKRNVRACSLDLVLDLVPNAPSALVDFHAPRAAIQSPESEYLRVVANVFRSVGDGLQTLPSIADETRDLAFVRPTQAAARS